MLSSQTASSCTGQRATAAVIWRLVSRWWCWAQSQLLLITPVYQQYVGKEGCFISQEGQEAFQQLTPGLMQGQAVGRTCRGISMASQ